MEKECKRNNKNARGKKNYRIRNCHVFTPCQLFLEIDKKTNANIDL